MRIVGFDGLMSGDATRIISRIWLVGLAAVGLLGARRAWTSPVSSEFTDVPSIAQTTAEQQSDLPSASHSLMHPLGQHDESLSLLPRQAGAETSAHVRVGPHGPYSIS